LTPGMIFHFKSLRYECGKTVTVVVDIRSFRVEGGLRVQSVVVTEKGYCK